jgi:hypothetical protein
MAERKLVSDTVTVTADGRTIVDIKKLIAKKHIQEMIGQMRAKTKIVSARQSRQLVRQTD